VGEAVLVMHTIRLLSGVILVSAMVAAPVSTGPENPGNVRIAKGRSYALAHGFAERHPRPEPDRGPAAAGNASASHRPG
jgi:hypothetical protein